MPLKESVQKRVLKTVSQFSNADVDESGHVTYVMSTCNPLSQLDSNAVKEIMDNPNHRGKLYEIASEICNANKATTVHDLADVVGITMFSDARYENENHGVPFPHYFPSNRDIEEFLKDNITIVPNIEAFEKNTTVCTDIFIDTGDANGCFDSNYIYFKNPMDKEGRETASIVWLAEKQGYSEEELRAELQKDVPENPTNCLESIHKEIATSCLAKEKLVVLVKMSLGELLDLNDAMQPQQEDYCYHREGRPDCGTFKIRKNAHFGLCNGGSLDIKLDKPFEMPINFIYEAVPDVCKEKASIKSIYNIPDDAWKGNSTWIKDEWKISDRLHSKNPEVSKQKQQSKSVKNQNIDIS